MRTGTVKLIAAMLVFCVFAAGCGEYRGGNDSGELDEYISVADYKNIKITVNVPEVPESGIDVLIDEMLAGLSERIEVSDGVKAGDAVTFSAYCIVDGESYPDMSVENRMFVFGGEQDDFLIPLLVPSMAGMKKGETAEMKVTLPAGKIEGKSGDYGVIYRVTVLSVLRTVTPALTDESAERLIAGCGGVSGLRERLRAKLTAEKKAEARVEAEAELWEKVVDGSTVISTPYGLFSEKYDGLCSTYEASAKSLNMSFNEYLEKYYGMNESEFENELNEKATEMMKETLVIRAVAAKEGIECTDEALNGYASVCAASSAGEYADAEEYIERVGLDNVKEQYLKEKVLSVLMEYCSAE